MDRYILLAFFATAPLALTLAESCSEKGMYDCEFIGFCVPLDAKCDGKMDCPTGRDERHTTCYNHYCHPSNFRCAYGACVNSSTVCNKERDCAADNSDELVNACYRRNATFEGNFLCVKGGKVPIYQQCDGTKDCADGSDESLYACAGRRCATGQFQCAYGACISNDFLCNGHIECADGSDESSMICSGESDVTARPVDVMNGYADDNGEPDYTDYAITDNDDPKFTIVINAANPFPGQWKCLDGTIIPQEGRCDGKYDCPDKSDETHALCWNNYCPENYFRCQYGSCVASSLFCNGISDCADGSDEILRRCNNETQLHDDQFICKGSGERIPSFELCDGVKNCADGCDETLYECAGRYCSHSHFQCAYGACVDASAKCDTDSNWDCADGSDEDYQLCNRVPPPPPVLTPCEMPVVDHGVVLPLGPGQASPGGLAVAVICELPYRPDSPVISQCYNGSWSPRLAQCELFCELPRHTSVSYYCGDTECDYLVPSGTVVKPRCKNHYISMGKLQNMTCTSGTWDYLVTCSYNPLVHLRETRNGMAIQFDDFVVSVSGSRFNVSVDLGSDNIWSLRVPRQESGVISTESGQETQHHLTPATPKR